MAREALIGVNEFIRIDPQESSLTRPSSELILLLQDNSIPSRRNKVAGRGAALRPRYNFVLVRDFFDAWGEAAKV